MLSPNVSFTGLGFQERGKRKFILCNISLAYLIVGWQIRVFVWLFHSITRIFKSMLCISEIIIYKLNMCDVSSGNSSIESRCAFQKEAAIDYENDEAIN